MRYIPALALAALVSTAPGLAAAAVISGSFTGVIDPGWNDTSGVFGTPGALDGAAISGTFTYDTSLLSQVLAGTTNTASATGYGALQVSITIGGGSHLFTDQTSASLYLDTAASEFTLQNANSQSGDGFGVAETFFLDALDPLTPFLLSTDLDQGFITSPLLGSGSFTINDTGPDGVASAGFSITSLRLVNAPEPASAALLLAGLAGLAASRRRR